MNPVLNVTRDAITELISAQRSTRVLVKRMRSLWWLSLLHIPRVSLAYETVVSVDGEVESSFVGRLQAIMTEEPRHEVRRHITAKTNDAYGIAKFYRQDD